MAKIIDLADPHVHQPQRLDFIALTAPSMCLARIVPAPGPNAPAITETLLALLEPPAIGDTLTIETAYGETTHVVVLYIEPAELYIGGSALPGIKYPALNVFVDNPA